MAPESKNGKITPSITSGRKVQPVQNAQIANILTKEEILGILKKKFEERGISFKSDIALKLKIPGIAKRSDNEVCAFFDVNSAEPKASEPYLAFNAENPKPPEWLREWYLGISKQLDGIFLILFFKPKNIFVRCRLEEADQKIPDIMQASTPGRKA